MLELHSLIEEIKQPAPWRAQGRITAVNGTVVTARVPHAAPGDLCHIATRSGKTVAAQVIAFNEELFTLAPLDRIDGISPGAVVTNTGSSPTVLVSDELLGRVVNASGNIIDDLPPPTRPLNCVNVFSTPPPALSRLSISKQLVTGVKTIDGLCPIGYGQRMGLFAGPGLGKSTLLGMIAKHANVDVIVIGLIGERGREVLDFINEALGPGGLKRSVVVVATSDEPPVRRMLAARSATAIAEYFRDQGQRVLLLMDSLTRLARAIRDVSLAAGELPVRQGFTPSVYAELPLLLERSGTSSRGSITAIYTVLSSSENESDPLADEVKSLLDGHLVLSQNVASQGIRPAIDPLRSISRLSSKLQSTLAQETSNLIIEAIDALRSGLEVQAIGGFPSPSQRAALALAEKIKTTLGQTQLQSSTLSETQSTLNQLALEFRGLRAEVI